jgi:hypothetical protein
VATQAVIAYEEARLARRLSLLGVLWTVYGVLELFRAAAVHFFTRFAHFWLSGPDWTQWAGPWVLGWIMAWSLFNAALAFAAAWGLSERRLWGRTLAIVAAVFALAHPILGTILGVYTLVVLLSANVGVYYDRMART